MDRGDRPRSFAYRRGAALDRPVPDVAGREYSRQARFHIKRVPIENPALGAPVIAQQIGPSEDIARTVAKGPGFSSPLSLRCAAETEKEATGFHRALLAHRVVSEGNCLECLIPMQRNDLMVE